jgi:hypothetical protein
MSERAEIVLIAHRWILMAARTGDDHAATRGMLRDVERYDRTHKAPMPAAARERQRAGKIAKRKAA